MAVLNSLAFYSPLLRNQRGALDGIQLGPALVEIGLALFGDLVLVGARVVPILVVKHVHNLHSWGINDSEGRKALRVEPGVVLQIDEDLSRTGIGHACLRVGQVAALVTPDQ